MTLANEEKDKIEVLFKKLEEHCLAQQNVTMERYRFQMRCQRKDEMVSQFVTALKLLAAGCKFGELMNDMIKDRIVCGISSEHVKERLLRETNLALKKAIGIRQVDEESKKQVKILKDETTAVESTMEIMKDEEQNSRKRHRGEETVRNQHRCRKCGTLHKWGECIAFGKKCLKCGKLGHFAKCCRAQRKVETITNVADHSQFVGGISQNTKADTDENGCYVTLNTQDTPVRFKVNTGSQANIIPHFIFMKMENRPKLKPTNMKLISYTGENLKISGSCKLRCGEKVLNFFIVRTNQRPILSFQASQVLNLIKVVMNVTTQEIDYLITEYSGVFEGLGCLDQPYHIKIDNTVQPIVCLPQNIPVALRERVRDEIDRMEKLGVLKKNRQCR